MGDLEMCPGHPDQPRIHCACEAGRALYPCPACRTLRSPIRCPECGERPVADRPQLHLVQGEKR